jgi:hypothetical protein
MAIKSKKWLMAKMLADMGKDQLTLFKAFEKPQTDYDNFLTQLEKILGDSKFIIKRAEFSNLRKREVKMVTDRLSEINLTLCQYLLTNCHKSTKYSYITKEIADKMAVIPDYVSCTEYYDLIDIQDYISRTYQRFSGILIANSRFTAPDDILFQIEPILKKLNYYIKYDV